MTPPTSPEQLFAELLSIWHTHRALIIAVGVGLALVVRFTRQSRDAQEEGRGSPAPAAGVQEKTVELRPEWLPENTTVVPRALSAEKHAEDDASAVAVFPKAKRGPKTVKGRKTPKKIAKPVVDYDHTTDKIQPLIFFQSVTGSTERRAKRVAELLTAWTAGCDQAASLLAPQLLDLSEVDYDDYFISAPKAEANTKHFYLILAPTYNIDTLLDAFIENLSETHNDFRIDTASLSGLLGYSVFGFGDKEGWPSEEEGFCTQAKQVDKWMARLTGRKRAYPLGMGDVKSDAEDRLTEWRVGVQEALVEIAEGRGLGEGVLGSGDAVESDEEGVDDGDSGEETRRVDDVEDLGGMADGAAAPIPVDFTNYKGKPRVNAPAAPKQMVPITSPTHAALTKQGYSIIGSHSGVKICRWTKSALRGRGSCYKYSFYGIASHLCMEATPSLSCSNKCVFCWRHGTNPVGTTWRWVTDAPDVIFDGITAAHYKKIKMMKGVPGVRAERFAEAMRIRHCALSLVGEPIFYPHINELLRIMHEQRISTFMVCNAQHPAQLASLIPVTQLYVSIDASNKESLRKVDRPLHRDFWERFCACLDVLRARRFEQRTVFRLTLVKGFNMEEEVQGYADLVERALPCFVEVKGVTYCGTSAAGSAGLTMQNVPFYEEVAAFVQLLETELASRGLAYGIAAEHAHSCCILLADGNRFKRDGRWATRIDFERFFALSEGAVQGSRLQDGKVVGWRPEDYIGPDTPEWALWGNKGFDPRDQRVDRKGRPRTEEEAQASLMQAALRKAAREL
ncbi:uncharacterized protein M421DRAFT_8929 [Didymella exigua CBS 183.55]|uniref:tRNA 4-demethylwyosine synthase (AdoMet-dependent) n=1 Tax=Didymella exigua CBS 183.55 TaxID=1150837 RepID=A0A6A5R7X3_9PLEO|nr:uncharacterized protein M421DRAFT_8929 [Didymella exigua CBS 183.55]KAF1924281.1 hypothetical protein M421DRAFT_8929 [Didymella exigua CBS 183.55]